IRSAVASFALEDVHVNLIDTPGHPDFIAEVERVLSVLDGAVLVLSAVEGVQPQTRILMRALQRLRIPTLMFVNKIDRPGAGEESLMSGITELLPPSTGDPEGPLSGTVFKIERGANGEKIAYVRMFSGTIHIRERLRFGRSLEDKVTAITVFERGPAAQRSSV